MKWETYNKMTPEQKEEYNYRFSKSVQLVGFNEVLFSCMGILFSMSLFQLRMPELAIKISEITRYYTIFIAFLMLIQIIIHFIKLRSRMIWIKERGI